MTKKAFKSKSKENPFEKFANSKKKHEVVNRRVKGEDRNVGRARGKAIEVRKNKLVEDINSSKKSNNFVDRRFGENNTNLSMEEKMFLRFQQERAKKAKRTKFNLDSAETPVLTHKGQILGSSIAQDGWSESSDDENLGKDVVQNLHFGGGFLPAHQSNEPLQHKHRADILQEIVMKSKLHKLEKKEAKNVQEDQRELLDKAYAELLHSSSLEFKPTRRDRSEEVGPDDADEYDKSLRVMAFESRVKPSDRTLTKEEIALAEYQKLAQLEHERLQRMKPDFHPEKREAVMNDDCIDDLAFPTELSNPSSEDLSESEDVSTVDNSHTDDESVGDGDIDNADDSDDEEQNVASDELVQVSLTHDFVSSKEIMPHSIECPLHFKDFRHLVDLYVSNAEQFSTLVDRILTWNSIYLPGVKLENEKKMTTFFDILMNYFISLGDSLQLSIQTKEVFFMIESLSAAIFRLAKDLPHVAQQLFLKKLESLQQQLTAALLVHADSRCWPTVGNILLFQLFGVMLSITDFRHCIIQPSQLLICQFLVQCPIISFQDLGSAILLSGILLNYTSITKESAPEILMVLRRSFDYLLSTGNHSIESWIQFPSLPIAWSIFDITSSDQHSPSVLSSLLSITDVVLKDYPKEVIVDIVFRLHQLFPSSTHHSILKEFPTLWDKYSKSSVTPIRSLSWREPKRVTEVMLTPAFEVDYKMKSSIQGTNPEKLKLKVLNKQLKREQKASMRELRRDSEFLDQEYFAERSKSLYENKLERVRNYSWLQQEQATFNQQVRKNSKDALKGGGSGSAKKSRKV